jgi:hypothetical protein
MTNNTSDKTILELETLSKQYDIILKQYQQTVLDYVSFLKQTNQTDTFITIKGQSFWGAQALSTLQNSTLAKCKISCATTTNCSGATFDSKLSNCYLRSGKGQATVSSKNYTAIVSKNIYYITTLQKLNNDLTIINSKILAQINGGYKAYETNKKNNTLLKNKLVKNYYALVKERELLNEQIQEYQNINEDFNDTNLKTNANYNSYLLLLFFVIIFIIVLMKYSLSKKLNNS